MVFFTSDTHFCHKLMSDMRGFDSTDEMNERIITTWNVIVGKHDTVYHLGDFGFKHDSIPHIRHSLNGRIVLVLGNHDLKNRIHNKPLWTCVYELKTISVDKTPVVLCHYPIRSWDRSHYNSFHLYGHMHNGLNSRDYPVYGKSFDIGWDMWGRPLEWSEVRAKFAGLPDNPNLINR